MAWSDREGYGLREIYIQYFTDFHLLAALSAFDLGGASITLIGPESAVSISIVKILRASHLKIDPRRPACDIQKLLRELVHARYDRSCTVVSPFVYPTYTISMLLKHGRYPSTIIRTDEGVGSYASFRHLFKCMSLEDPSLSTRYRLSRALLQR